MKRFGSSASHSFGHCWAIKWQHVIMRMSRVMESCKSHDEHPTDSGCGAVKKWRKLYVRQCSSPELPQIAANVQQPAQVQADIKQNRMCDEHVLADGCRGLQEYEPHEVVQVRQSIDKNDVCQDAERLLSVAGMLVKTDKKRKLCDALDAVATLVKDIHADVETYQSCAELPEVAKAAQPKQVKAHENSYKSFDEHVRLDACAGWTKCSRCAWEKRGREWQHRLDFYVAPFKCPIVEKPADMGGAWGIGCTLCAQFARYHGVIPRYFACFKFGTTSKSRIRFWDFKHHLESQGHKDAVELFLHIRGKDELDDVRNLE